MKRKNKYLLSALLMLLFVLWTVVVSTVDVSAAGPIGSSVGLATLNVYLHRLTGVELTLYRLTDALSLVPAAFMALFAGMGCVQLIRRKSLLRVDRGILSMGVFYAALMAFYVGFEVFPVNFRPVLIDGLLEASYPSSTTLLVLSVMPAAAICLRNYIHKPLDRYVVFWLIGSFSAFMVVARFLSGVHWFTDIVGGMLLSAALVTAYYAYNETGADTFGSRL